MLAGCFLTGDHIGSVIPSRVHNAKGLIFAGSGVGLGVGVGSEPGFAATDSVGLA